MNWSCFQFYAAILPKDIKDILSNKRELNSWFAIPRLIV